MKKTFYFFIFIFLTAAVYAQKSIHYVSFFPVSVTQTNVSLTQDNKSFSLLNGNSGHSVSNPYHTYNGGLILGATDNAQINVNNLNITGSKAINSILVDNALEIVSIDPANNSLDRIIEEVQIGNKEWCYDCENVFISAPNINIAWSKFEHKDPITSYYMNINADRTTTVKGIYLKNNGGSYKEFLPGLTPGTDKLGWVKLRLKGDDTCRKYLVKYQGNTKPNDRCSDPTVSYDNPSY